MNPFTTVQREEVGNILKITPQINEGTAVLLKISQEASSIAASSQQVSSTDLITNKRTITTNVMVEDGGIIVLGGLISDEVRESKSQVPFLGSIPILGELFKTRSVDKVKTNLMVFIRPRILRDGTDAAIESNAKYNYIRDQQTAARTRARVPLMPGERQPTLPALEQLVPPELLNPTRQAAPPGRRRLSAHRPPAAGPRSDDTTGMTQPPATAPPPPPPPPPTTAPVTAARRRSASRTPDSRARGWNHAVNTAATEAAILAAAGRVTDPLRPLPFAFAKRHGVLVRAVADDDRRRRRARRRLAHRARRSAATSAAPAAARTRDGRAVRGACCAKPTRQAPAPRWTRWAASRKKPTSPTSRRTSRNLPTCSRARTKRRSSG